MIGDRSTSDVVVRLRTPDGRDEWVYCHSHILTGKCKYYADRLSENWPTCQILDSRNCVEVYCQEHDFDYHITILRLFYVSIGCSVTDMWHGVRNALGILKVAVELDCPETIAACVNYLEAAPWEETEEEEILKSIPGMGSLAEPILARLHPVNPAAIVKVFLSAFRFATSSPPSAMNDLKSSAQEQIEYMLTEDDDAPLLTVNDEIISEVRLNFKGLLARFNTVLMSLSCVFEEATPDPMGMLQFHSYLVDLTWACQISTKLEIMKDVVNSWIEVSENVVKVVQQESSEAKMLEMKLKVVEVTAKVVEAIGYGNVILPTSKRLHTVNVWLPFVRATKQMIDSHPMDGNDYPVSKMDGEVWQALESAFVSIVLALPSGNQAEILTEWLGNKHIMYPDLTEVFEVWCYRSKVANRRLSIMGFCNGTNTML